MTFLKSAIHTWQDSTFVRPNYVIFFQPSNVEQATMSAFSILPCILNDKDFFHAYESLAKMKIVRKSTLFIRIILLTPHSCNDRLEMKKFATLSLCHVLEMLEVLDRITDKAHIDL